MSDFVSKLKKLRRDGWSNVLTGVGVSGRDKRLGGSFAVEDPITLEDLEQRWTGDDIAARVIETLPREALREGFDVVVKNDPEGGKPIAAAVEEIEASPRLQKALEFERAFGGALLLLGADDGALNWSEPLDETRIKSFTWMHPLTPSELFPVAWQTDFRSPDYGMPTVYRIQPLNNPPGVILTEPGNLVHVSRVVRLTGVKISNRPVPADNDARFGFSVLQRCDDVIRDFQAAWGGAFTMAQDFAVPVLKVAGLSTLISTNDPGVLAKRLSAIEQMRSVINAMLIDKDDEDYTRVATPLSGLADLLDQTMYRLSLAADMPVSLLMGRAPAGLNATGQSDIQQFYDRVSSYQTRTVGPALKKIIRLKLLSKDGPTAGKLPDDWDVEWNPLFQLAENQMADVRLKQAQTDALMIENGVLTRQIVARNRYGGSRYSTNTLLRPEELKAVSAIDDMEQEAMQAANDAAAAPPPAPAPKVKKTDEALLEIARSLVEK